MPPLGSVGQVRDPILMSEPIFRALLNSPVFFSVSSHVLSTIPHLVMAQESSNGSAGNASLRIVGRRKVSTIRQLLQYRSRGKGASCDCYDSQFVAMIEKCGRNSTYVRSLSASLSTHLGTGARGKHGWPAESLYPLLFNTCSYFSLDPETSALSLVLDSSVEKPSGFHLREVFG